LRSPFAKPTGANPVADAITLAFEAIKVLAVKEARRRSIAQ
jgi:hypothetical protein